MKYTLPSQITISEIELTIQDLNRSIEFYTQVIGFSVRTRNQHSAELGTETSTLVRVIENPKAQKTRGTTGLYHFAILVPQRRVLAKSLTNIIETQTPVQGFADHGVSEAIYLPDPDGNGIEIYRDRPYQEWPFNNGELRMVTDPLDVENLLSEINGNNGQRFKLPGKTKIGHMHLHVRDIPEAVSFYQDVLGFDLKQRYGPSAAFLAAGNYHHHIGINTWAGVGALPSPEGSIGLRSFTISLPTSKDLDTLEGQIQQAGKKGIQVNDGFIIRDPSNNQIQFKVD
jgi:catechol 2,3-dioxygenase